MGKPKHLLKSDKPKGKRPQPVPETADEFLAAGVDFESAGEKWRAGDAAKSCRFFVRALDTYQAGLQRFPRDFDLAYNKARVQLDLAQQPRLLKHLPTKLSDLLQVALDSHRYALTLRSDDADTLFNTAQLLGIIAEPIAREGGTVASNAGGAAIPLLEESLQLLERCLNIQERQLIESEAQAAAVRNTETQVDPTSEPATNVDSHDDPSSPPSTDEQWASVVEPVTRSTLLDTCTAQMQALTSLIPLVADSREALQNIESASAKLLDKASSLVTEEDESAMSYHSDRAKLIVALARVSFSGSLISLQQYSEALTSSYSFASFETSSSALCDFAEVAVDFNTAVSEVATNDTSVALRWKQLSDALVALAKAVKLPDANDLAAIHGRRADIELFRVRLAEPPSNCQQAVSNKSVLLKNAETYYRGAAKLAGAAGDMETEKEMQGRETVVKMIREDGGANLCGLESILNDMREEGLV